MKPCCYTNADLHVTSELPIPEWAAFESDRPCPQPDVTITVESGERLSRPDEESGEGGPPPLEGEGVESEKFETRLITGDEYRFHAPHAGEYWVRQGRAIHITSARNAPFFAWLGLGRVVLSTRYPVAPFQRRAGWKRGLRLLRRDRRRQVFACRMAD